jgi:tight adherence protein B
VNALPILFFLAVLLASVFLLRAIGLSVFGEARRQRREFERAFDSESSGGRREPELLRRPHLARLSPFERRIESRSELKPLIRLIEGAGLAAPAYRVLLEVAVCAILVSLLFFWFWSHWSAVLGGALVGGVLPIARLWWLRHRRIAKIEAQLADAIDTVKRSLRAGNPFVSTFRLVAESMEAPIATEFALAAADLSYGSDPRSALLAMLDRVPSVPLRGFVTAILVQRETGGNLAETLDHLSSVIRERFRFERKVRTLTAEGRLSAWILIAVPFVVGAALHFSSPKYLTALTESPQGPMLLGGCAVLMLAGVLWMQRIARVKV